MSEARSEFFSRLDGSAISTYILMMLVVPLKSWCRISHQRSLSLGWDDMMTVLALCSINAFFYVCRVGMGPNLAKHFPSEVSTAEAINFLKYLFAGEVLYVTSLSTIKYSILLLYWRIFSVASRVPIAIAFSIVTAWVIAILFLIIFACDPVQASWDITITNRKCISLHAVYLATSTPNVITDVLVLILPLPYIYRLYAPVAQRLAIAGMFSLGCFVSVVSIVRLTILVRIPLTSADTTYNVREVIIWSIIELNLGLIGACLPSMKPALRLLRLDRVVPGLACSSGTPGQGGWAGTGTTLTSRGTGPKRLTNERRRPRRKGLTGGLFSTLTGLTRWDEEEDAFEMMHVPSLGAEAAGRQKEGTSFSCSSGGENHKTDTDVDTVHSTESRRKKGVGDGT